MVTTKAKLRPRARIIRTVGDQLISGPEAAVIELVKNAYDADSSRVDVKITPSIGKQAAGIIVRDFGHGMTTEDVIHRWLEPATDEKQIRGLSPEGRPMLGAKGIGRFAAARLGSRTTLTTIARVSKQTVVETSLSVNWEEFTATKFLEDIEILVNSREIENAKLATTGVLLEIFELRDAWSEKKLSNLIRELRRVVAPDVNATSFEIWLDLSGFTREFNGFDGNKLLAEINTDPSRIDADDVGTNLIAPFKLYDHADYKLVGHFGEDGVFHGHFAVTRADGKQQSLVVPAPPISEDEAPCGEVDLTLNVYDREAEAVEKLFERMGLPFEKIGIRAARKIISEQAGIALYRNGFRIRPYGDPENDWLELERQRVQDPSRKLGQSQVSGRIEIRDEPESGLVERSSREGLEHNGQFERLKVLIANVLLHVEQRRLAFREKAGIGRRSSSDIRRIRDEASLKTLSRVVKKLPAKYRASLELAIEQDSNAIAKSLDELEAYQTLLQSRVALGSVIAQVIHEGRRFLTPMATSAKIIFENHELLLHDSAKGKVLRKQLPDHANTIYEGTRLLAGLFKQLDPLSGRRRGKPTHFKVSAVIDSSLHWFEQLISKLEITVRVNGSPHTELFGYPGDFQSAVLNIVDNAIFWLETVPINHRHIEVAWETVGRIAQIRIKNTGPDIDVTYFDRLFEPGFSLKAAGNGLGLSIAREAVRASKGDVWIDSATSATTFVISFPQYSESR